MNRPYFSSTKGKVVIAFFAGCLCMGLVTFANTINISTSLTNALQYIQHIILTDTGGDDGEVKMELDGTNGDAYIARRLAINTSGSLYSLHVNGFMKLQTGTAINNIATTMSTTDQDSVPTTEAVSGYVQQQLQGISTDNFYLTDATFSTGDGNITFTVTGATNVVLNLDGRYLQNYTETDPTRTNEKASYYTKTESDDRYVPLVASGNFVNTSDGQTINGAKVFNDQLTANTDMVVNGNLFVYGTSTTLNTESLTIEDHQIYLGNVASPTDETANNGGIVVLGDTNKFFTRDNANDSRDSSEHMNLDNGKTYRINDVGIFNLANTYIPYFDGVRMVQSILIQSGSNIGIGTADPQAKLDINGGIKIGNDTAACSAEKVGTMRYRVIGTTSYFDICMQTEVSTYDRSTIKTFTW